MGAVLRDGSGRVERDGRRAAGQAHMTDRRLAKIVAIIGRDKANVEFIEEKLLYFDRKRRFEIWSPYPPGPQNKREKLIASSFAGAIGKLEKRFNNLDEALKNLRHPRHADATLESAVLHRALGVDLDQWKAQLTDWRKRLDYFSGKPRPKTKGALLDDPTTWPLGPPKPSAPRFVRKHDAVKTAAEILDGHGLRLTATRKSDTGKGSLFCQVAAIVSSDRDLYHQCRQFLKMQKLPKERNRGSK
jgi:hypothetical protein